MKYGGGLIIGGLLWLFATNAQALTVEEILLLKQNGVSEKTIQMMIDSEMQAQQPEVTAGDRMGVETITRPDGRPAIVYSTGSDQRDHDARERLKEKRAWEMLRHLIVDTRSAED